jgi:hypothetical protein
MASTAAGGVSFVWPQVHDCLMDGNDETESAAAPGRFRLTPEQVRILVAVVSVIVAVVLVLLGFKFDNAQRSNSPASPVPTNSPHHYPNCEAAWADGRSNIPRGDPDYHPALDRDGNGWACQK